MNKIHKVNEETLDFLNLRKLLASGDKFVCDKCDSELIIALTLEDSNRLKVMPGIYCPMNGKHIFIHVNLQESRDKMHRVFEKINKDREDKNNN